MLQQSQFEKTVTYRFGKERIPAKAMQWYYKATPSDFNRFLINERRHYHINCQRMENGELQVCILDFGTLYLRDTEWLIYFQDLDCITKIGHKEFMRDFTGPKI